MRHAPPARRGVRHRAGIVALLATASTIATLTLSPTGQRRPATPIAADNTATAPSPTATHPPPLIDTNRTVDAGPHVTGWAVADAITGRIMAEHGGAATTITASIIKVWLGADAVRGTDDDPNEDLANDAWDAIAASDNTAATRLYRNNGGRTGIARMAQLCELYHTLPHATAWGETLMSAIDMAKLGACITRGRAAGPNRTDYILDAMRSVYGTGRFGPVTVLPTELDIATKNGWLIHNGKWVVNCLAIIEQTWSLAIATTYPARLGMAYGASLCNTVTRQLAGIPGPVASVHLATDDRHQSATAPATPPASPAWRNP